MQRQDLIGREALDQSGDDRDAAGDARLEGNGPAMPARGVEHLGAVLGEQGLVGGHHVLAGRQQVEDGTASPVHPAGQLGGDLNVRIGQHRAQVRGQEIARHGDGAGFRQVADHHPAQDQRATRTGGQPVGVLQQ